MKRYQVTIVGETPLLMHRNSMVDDDHLAVRGDDRTQPNAWRQCLYVWDGRVVLPEVNLKAALEHAGSKGAIDGVSATTLKASVVNDLFFSDPYLRLLVGTDRRELLTAAIDTIDGTFLEQTAAVAALGFTLDVRAVAVKASKQVRVRPSFSPWGLEGAIDVYGDILTESRLTELFTRAGKVAGLCDWRPGSPRRPGPFGRFGAWLRHAR